MTEEDDEQKAKSKWKAWMLERLEVFRRRVETGEVLGLLILGERQDGGCSYARVGMPTGPLAAITLGHLVGQIEERLLERVRQDDDHGPSLDIIKGARLGLPRRDRAGKVQGPEAVSGVREDGNGKVQVLRPAPSPEEAEAVEGELKALMVEFCELCDEQERIWDRGETEMVERRFDIVRRQREIFHRQREIHDWIFSRT